jgi:hypothetical protein
LTAKQAVEYVQLFKPSVFMPAHHDAGFSGHTPLWRATEPVFQAIKDEGPDTVTVSRGYREPVCFPGIPQAADDEARNESCGPVASFRCHAMVSPSAEQKGDSRRQSGLGGGHGRGGAGGVVLGGGRKSALGDLSY